MHNKIVPLRGDEIRGADASVCRGQKAHTARCSSVQGERMRGGGNWSPFAPGRGKITSREETGYGLFFASVFSGKVSRRQRLEHLPARKTTDDGGHDTPASSRGSSTNLADITVQLPVMT